MHLRVLSSGGVWLQVHREEFLMFVLQHLGIVDADDMEQILAIFDAFDRSGDGVLDINDVRRSVSGRHPDISAAADAAADAAAADSAVADSAPNPTSNTA